MKKAFLIFAMLCNIGLIIGCKSSVNDDTPDTTIAESRIYDMLPKGDTLLSLFDGLQYNDEGSAFIKDLPIVVTKFC